MTTLIRHIANALRPVLALSALAAILGLGGCGGGGTGGTALTAPPAPAPAPLSIQPATVTVEIGAPTTFTVTGGTPPYKLFSSIPGVLPVPSSSTTGVFVLTANTVSADTSVDITVQDSSVSAATVKATVTVKGAVTTPPVPLKVIPTSFTLYNNTSSIISATGGTPPYTLISDNQAVIPSQTTPSASGNFLVLASNVATPTTVNLTIKDAQGSTVTTAATVTPVSVVSTLTVTPTAASPGQGCAPAVCSGGDATASVTLKSTLGAPIQGRQVRFDVVQGNYSIQTGSISQPSVTTMTVGTDQNGVATVRILATTTAPTQVALIKATDVSSGNQVTGSFTIAQFTDGSTFLTVIPNTATIGGPDNAHCSSGDRATYYIFGGTPPYRIVAGFPDSVTITGAPVTTNGGGFTVESKGICLSPLNLVITDATGRTVTATFNTTLGTTAPPGPNPLPIDIAPDNVTIIPTKCNADGTAAGGTAQAIISGGTGTFVIASSDATHLLATASGQLLLMTLQNTPLVGSSYTVKVTDGLTGKLVTVTVGNCQLPSGPVISPLILSSVSTTMTCGETQNFPVSGGTSPYAVKEVPTWLTAAFNTASTLSVTRKSGAAGNATPTNPGLVIINDANGTTASLSVTGNPATCP
jgi:hypothetical protein